MTHTNPFGAAAECHQIAGIPQSKVDLPIENNFECPCLMLYDHPDL